MMNKTILDFAMTTSVIIGYFVSIALVTTSFYKSRANNYLSLSLFLISTLILIELPGVIKTNIAFEILNLFMLDILFAATLFTYFIIQINHQLLNNCKYHWLFLPFVCSVILEISLFLFDLYGSTLDILIYYIKDVSSFVFNIFLVFWGRKLILKATTISEGKKFWLLRLNLFIIIIIANWILTRVEFHIFNSVYTFYLLWTLLCLFLWWILYYGVFKLQIIAQKEELHNYLVSKKAHNSQTKKKINSTSTTKIITQLYQLMEEEELYKNPLLSRLDLATRLEISESSLSQIINQDINKSIIQFVNDYRIEAAKNLLHNSVFNKYSLEAIGLEAGFKSKSAFYNVFKTSLSMSPGAYRKLQKRPNSCKFIVSGRLQP